MVRAILRTSLAAFTVFGFGTAFAQDGRVWRVKVEHFKCVVANLAVYRDLTGDPVVIFLDECPPSENLKSQWRYAGQMHINVPTTAGTVAESVYPPPPWSGLPGSVPEGAPAVDVAAYGLPPVEPKGPRIGPSPVLVLSRHELECLDKVEIPSGETEFVLNMADVPCQRP